MIRAIIFDLDSCLCASNEAGDHLFAPAFDAIRRANGGTHSEEDLRSAFADCLRCAFDFVAEKHRFTDAMREAGAKHFVEVEVVSPMFGYGDLDVLGQLPVLRFLVTSGYRRFQESKVSALGIRDLFEAVFVDAINEPGRKGKEGFFGEILSSRRLLKDEVLVVGDNPDSEIAAGNRLGIRTVQILRPGVTRTDAAQFHIRGLAELKPLLML